MTAGSLLIETADAHGAFPRLGREQLDLLHQYGRRRRTQPGEVLVSEGDRDRDFLVVLSGIAAIYEGYGTAEQRLLRRHGPGRFLDELGLLTGQPALTSAVVAQPGEVLAVPVPGLRGAVSRDPRLGDLILRAFMARRELSIDQLTGIRIIGSRFSAGTRRLRDFAARNRLPHTVVDLEEDRHAEQLIQQLGVSPAETPVVIIRGAGVLRDPSNAELAQALGLPPADPAQPAREVQDLVVVGAGPGGLGAAVYGASEGLATVVLDAVATGGQAGASARIENFLGFPAGISGAELADRAVVQARRFGAAIRVPVEATALTLDEGYHIVSLDDGSQLRTRTVVVATGARYRKLDLPDLEQYEGTSVYYAATLMEGRLCHQEPVVVVGGGNSAGQAAIFLSRYTRSVRLLVRHHDLGRDMSRYLVEEVKRSPSIDVMLDTTVRELDGDDGVLRAVVAENHDTGERSRVPATRLFVFIGAEPHTGWLQGCLELDDQGYVLTGQQLSAAAGRPGWSARDVLETSAPGVLAVGDVRSGSVRRLASAVGEGAMAVRMIHKHLAATE
ncbi:FAD-dependent oxidoreductase [Natronosporangium hydrolyticum]|uniref:FAD-dependent oxidoreductase n=1 Tax=Natronosporangium hydrolyticum TaxID=2811111 RepID=A0A895YRM7_9ACTN|nr:FAD-dependent oxidoreductase [Natronosporangium hydrolyticum]QSB16678.1 FAD-dependent oxidoreductase [Natronosporangium hydrolyticum]